MIEHIHQQRLKLIDFLSKDVSRWSVEEIQNEIQSFYTVYSQITVNLGNCFIYRVRKIEDNESHDYLKDVWCPNSELVTKLGRANNINETMFYGALDPKTAVIETKIESGDMFSLAVYKLSTLASYNQSSIVIKEARVNRQNPDEFDLFGSELSKFMVNEFTKEINIGEEHKYAKTCALAKILMETPNKDSLLYPSVRNSDAINITMKESEAINRLSLDKVMTCKLEIINSEPQIVVSEIKKLIDNDSAFYKENHDSLPCPLIIEGNEMYFSTLFNDENIRSDEEIFNERMRQVREGTV